MTGMNLEGCALDGAEGPQWMEAWLLQQREYFGQYGKVLKVSISRTSAGAIQHFDNTCSGMLWNHKVLSCLAEKCGMISELLIGNWTIGYR
ncbi:hypothetical protein LOK49_LG06G03300 [Camellia lanceoleosa]|uniref:Uncharacterized protein n=1 Tax=Camellia lanceoleosa TaxID=1840588 RepID=A0ACC0HGJ3_9ERIC|nr:hypothetical protein LOK49_LG06G03300 [Camellia lanceoleosa]